ncbi:MAG: hypothetical protein ACTHMG_00150 [Sphingomonas sp.]
MRFVHALTAVAAVTIAAPAVAQSQFDGTWKIDTSSAVLPTKPVELSLDGATFSCASCAPAYSVPADGAFHPVAGQPYFDETSVTVVDPNTVKLAYRQKGKPVETLTETVSGDGKTMTYTDVDTSAPSGKPITTEGSLTRLTAGGEGAHAISGSWRNDRITSASDDALTMTIAAKGDTVSFTQPSGYHYTATLGGPPVPIVGDQANTMAAIKKSGPRSITETDSRDGKPVSTWAMTVEPDGKTMQVDSHNLLRGTTSHFKAFKQ